MSQLSPELKAIEEERGRVYGDPLTSHENIGLAWTGLIQQHYGIKLDHPLPAWLVVLMMVQLKAQRSARVFKDDNFKDAHVYLDFAERFQTSADSRPATADQIPLPEPQITSLCNVLPEQVQTVMLKSSREVFDVTPHHHQWMLEHRGEWIPTKLKTV